MRVKKSPFGQHGAYLYSIENDQGTVLEFSDYGARIVNVFVNMNGKHRNIVLGFDSAEEYALKDSYIGATIGRVAGRVSDASFHMDGKIYSLSKNDDTNCLHGGENSIDSQIWQTVIEEQEKRVTLRFSIISPAWDNGFPGNLEMTVSHTLTNDDQWIIEYQATTDKTTLFNPTNHVYFNLNQQTTDEIGNHFLSIAADKFGVLTDTLIPTGELRDVTGTPFDFRNPAGIPINQGLNSNYEQNALVNGYDHPFILSENIQNSPQVVLENSQRNIKIEMSTDAPAVVIYTSNMVTYPIEMRDSFQVKHGGVTLETQILPDAVNQDGFGSTILKPTELFKSSTTFKIITNYS
ncbi:aldose 1-epimerase [Trichococcus flocculiformis]|uniref:aldose epimerase family protein n=1 Tax=Trichococcus TaxID=82802 RepID=UPI0007A90AFC|nr:MULTISPECIES: aldose epimerase family protein [Trichococcus]CZR07482.1 aldose 1-/glucose-6-phosphate 1-epimerase [Trichococcus sp. ES5]SHF98702.1 aldose 1-epimerase [Trichococcus flocculiformis]